MVIKASSSREIDALISDLRSGTAARREAAVARLTVIGARAVERVLAVASSDLPAPARSVAFRTLEAIGDRRALALALGAIDDPDAAVAVAAIGLARTFLAGTRAEITVVDRLASAALDRRRPESVRLAAMGALRDLKASTLKPLLTALGTDPNVTVREAAVGGLKNRPLASFPSEPTMGVADDEATTDDPAALRRAIADRDVAISQPALLGIIERSRKLEASGPPGSRAEWTAVRGAAHVSLANRGSRVALYDLKESLETAATPLPADFLAALTTLADPSSLDAIAAASRKSNRAKDDWWRLQLAEVFQAIVKRRRLTRRSAVMKRIDKRWPGAVDALWPGRQ